MNPNHLILRFKKMSPFVIITLLVILIVGLMFFSNKYNSADSPIEKKPFLDPLEAEKIVNQLTELGYYKYADSLDIDSLKADLIASISSVGVLSSLYSDRPVIPKDYRYYFLDGESLFEQGGFDDALKDMSTLFQKMGLKIDVTEHLEEVDTITNGLNHHLKLNGKLYVIFTNFKDYGWGEAAQMFANMINDQLQIQNKDERLYLINGGNDGCAAFLTDQQFKLIDKILTDDEWKPLPVKKWAELFKVNN
jgi:hypothetical protein